MTGRLWILREGHLQGPTRVDMLAVIPVGLYTSCSVHACSDLILDHESVYSILSQRRPTVTRYQ
jgi:hypothetical protein